MSVYRWRCCLLLLLAPAAIICSCRPLASRVDVFKPSARPSQKVEGRSSVLPPIPKSPQAIQLEIVFVERPVDDPLLGEALWSQIDQVGELEPNTRKNLARNGFRAGHGGSRPPRALEEMLGLTSQYADDSQGRPQLVGRRLFLRPGAETEVQTSGVFPECDLTLTHGEASETESYRNARFVFRLKVRRRQDGWARIEFLPEVHHGQLQLRRVSGPNGWQLRTAQAVRPLFGLRFAFTLNVGEMVIISADSSAEGRKGQSLGRHFFRGVGDNDHVQRLLVVRLADMSNNDALYARSEGGSRNWAVRPSSDFRPLTSDLHPEADASGSPREAAVSRKGIVTRRL